MKIDNFISGYLPYLIGIRAVEGFKILDIQIPSSWKFGTPIVQAQRNYKKVQILVAEQEKDYTIISLVGDEEFQNFDTLFAHLDTIIKVNREREEKNRLFREKVKQLEAIFLNSDLETLNNLSFNVKDPEPELESDNKIELTNPADGEIDDSDVMGSLNDKMSQLNKKPVVDVPPEPQGNKKRELTKEEILQAERIAEAQEEEELEDD